MNIGFQKHDFKEQYYNISVSLSLPDVCIKCDNIIIYSKKNGCQRDLGKYCMFFFKSNKTLSQMSKALIHFTKIKYILLREIFSNICSNVLLQISQSPVSRPALNHFF